MAEQDQQFVEFVLKSVVDNPDDVQVDRTIDEMGVLISVTVNPADMGKVIGKSGQTAKAIRTLLKVVGAKNDARVNMKIIEPEGDQGGRDRGGRDTQDAPAPVSDAPAGSEAPAAGTLAGSGFADPMPGTTEAADDVPVQEASVAEAAAEQVDTDAAQEQPSENDAMVDEATAEPQAQEPTNVPEEEAPSPLNEKSPLDEL